MADADANQSTLSRIVSNPYVIGGGIIIVGILLLTQTSFFRGVSRVLGALGSLLVTALRALNKGLSFILTHPWLIIGVVAGFFIVKSGLGALTGMSEEDMQKGADKATELEEKGMDEEAAGEMAGMASKSSQLEEEDKAPDAVEIYENAVEKVEGQLNEGDVDGASETANEATDEFNNEVEGGE